MSRSREEFFILRVFELKALDKKSNQVAGEQGHSNGGKGSVHQGLGCD